MKKNILSLISLLLVSSPGAFAESITEARNLTATECQKEVSPSIRGSLKTICTNVCLRGHVFTDLEECGRKYTSENPLLSWQNEMLVADLLVMNASTTTDLIFNCKTGQTELYVS